VSVTPGQIVPVLIEKPAAGGRMIARVDGQVILVAGAIPGERVKAQIERVGRGVAYADAISIDEASPDRRDPFADPLCGGCLYAHIGYDRQLQIKAEVIADAFARIGHIRLPAAVRVHPSPDEGYRMRARLHVRGRRIGFFREGTHELCEARATKQLLPATCDVLDEVAAALQQAGANGVRELEVSENVDGSERVIHLDSAAPVGSETLERVRQRTGLNGLTLGWQVDLAVAGSPYVSDRLAVETTTMTLRRHVLAFFQGNRFLIGHLVAHVVGFVEEGAELLDLYAGAGLFSVAAALARSARVTAIEGDRWAALDLEANAGTAGSGIVAVHQPVEAFLRNYRSPADALVVDPPRTGMSREALDGVVRLGVPVVVYASCDVATLARDARRLIEAGYAIKSVEGFDLFPNTPHVETVVRFGLESSV
jgi:23S rRNA (uracil1939-C5)-methyltransferase